MTRRFQTSQFRKRGPVVLTRRRASGVVCRRRWEVQKLRLGRATLKASPDPLPNDVRNSKSTGPRKKWNSPAMKQRRRRKKQRRGERPGGNVRRRTVTRKSERTFAPIGPFLLRRWIKVKMNIRTFVPRRPLDLWWRSKWKMNILFARCSLVLFFFCSQKIKEAGSLCFNKSSVFCEISSSSSPENSFFRRPRREGSLLPFRSRQLRARSASAHLVWLGVQLPA